MSVRSTPSAPVIDRSGLSECLNQLTGQKSQKCPISTYRFQLHQGFRFADARGLVEYLHELGITHVYASPILKARSGSTHGYDIIDHNQINPEIGSEEEFRELTRELQARGMGLVLDFVPNHMGVGHGGNPWWQDVLENGRTSEYADFFDIDWQPLKGELRHKVLIPVLGDLYGAELEQGHIKLQYGETGFGVSYYDKRLPIDPQTIPVIFETMGDLRIQPPEISLGDAERGELEDVLWKLRELPPHSTAAPELALQRQREIPALKQRFRELLERSPQVLALVREALRRCNGTPGEAHSFDALHRVLEAQAYRLAYWRVSAQEINYRRFFDINDLAGLRMDNPRVFAATHKLLRRLLAQGCVSGVRLDHPDGMLNPIQYFIRLQMLYAASQCLGPEPMGPLAENGIELEVQEMFGQHDWMNRQAPLYALAEKILEPGETLPQNWPVDGTVGYEFVRLVNGIFVDQRNLRAFDAAYRRFIGGPIDIDTLIYESKKLIMHTALSSEVTVLSHMLDEISSTDRYARDFTRPALTDAIREAIACFPVYRTYLDERGGMSAQDRTHILEAITRAKRRNPGMAAALFDWLRDLLLLIPDEMAGPEWQRDRLRFTLKFQQLTGPVMAKGLEDTVCYVYNRFIAGNEVGCTPAEFGISVDEFHRGNLERSRHWPFSLLATSTHDTKRSEDVRARLDVLSEMPREWSRQVLRWRRLNRARKQVISDGRTVPDPNEEYFLYQTLVGAWPLSATARPAGIRGETESNEGGTAAGSVTEHENFVQRIQRYMNKALHEAKVNLSWVNPNPEYTAALEEFIARILEPHHGGKANAFRQQLEAFLPPVAFFGALNSLAQTLIKIAAPGVPDFYQGNELWDFSLVDPDNRRPVDFVLRRRLLREQQQVTSHKSQVETASDMPAGHDADQPHFAAVQVECEGPQRNAGNPLTLRPETVLPLLSEMLANWQDGRLKLWTTVSALRCRREFSRLFQAGNYLPVHATGDKQEHVVAFWREHGQEAVLLAVPRFAYSLMRGQPVPPLGNVWGGTELAIPGAYHEFLNVLTGERLNAGSGRNLLCRDIFANFPVALLRAL
jgi:(1->4)-alpha-D-glucan 1-alpha-D-glucosylmutase